MTHYCLLVAMSEEDTIEGVLRPFSIYSDDGLEIRDGKHDYWMEGGKFGQFHLKSGKMATQATKAEIAFTGDFATAAILMFGKWFEPLPGIEWEKGAYKDLLSGIPDEAVCVLVDCHE